MKCKHNRLIERRPPKKGTKLFLVVIGNTIIYRDTDQCAARMVQNACGDKRAIVLKARVYWDAPFKANGAKNGAT